MTIRQLQKRTYRLFRGSFGRTSLRGRQDDILKEAQEVADALDHESLGSELGDLGASLLTACEENGFQFEELVVAAHQKIKRRKQQYQTLGRKLNVALLGGAFDPVHIGHIAVAQLVLDTSRFFDEVWLVPCYRHMYGKQLEPFKHRIAMCRLAAAIDGRIKVFDYEGKHKLRGETSRFITKLLDDDKYTEEYRFAFIIGLDNARGILKWPYSEELRRKIPFVVVPRPGERGDKRVQWYLKAPHMFIQPDGQIRQQLVDCSSTDIRRDLARQGYDYPKRVLDEIVLKYIMENGLYENMPDPTATTKAGGH